jgi:hypothetical protein
MIVMKPGPSTLHTALVNEMFLPYGAKIGGRLTRGRFIERQWRRFFKNRLANPYRVPGLYTAQVRGLGCSSLSTRH